MLKRYGLIGYPLSHSFSPRFFTEKFEREGIDACYDVFPMSDFDEVKALLLTTPVEGFNVTIPYKEKIIPLLQRVDYTARQLGAVNCIVRHQREWHGYNTDIIGFEASLLSFCSLKNKKALVFGTGGSSKAVGYVLQKHQVPFIRVSRASLIDTITYDDLSESIMKEHCLLINTTPVGMFPDVDGVLPIPFHYVQEHHWVYDLVYNPERTKLMELAELRGAQVKNGYEMLILQAEASYQLFLTANAD